MCFGIFYKREMFQLKYHWVEIKYLGAIQNRRRQLFSRCDNTFFHYTSAIAACRRELERLDIPSGLVLNLDLKHLSYVSPAKYTLPSKGSTNIPIKGLEDKKNVTVNCVIAASASFLPIQVIY